jgi:AcrR family transcriptional regulator
VIRPTFYNHFQDKFELIEWIVHNDLLEPIEPLIGNGMIEEAMVLLFSNIERDKAFYMHVVKLEGPVTFHSIAQKCVGEVLLDVIRAQMKGGHAKHKWLTPEIIAGYYAQTMCFAAEEWIKQGMTVSPREMAAAYQYIMTHSMTEVIEAL